MSDAETDIQFLMKHYGASTARELSTKLGMRAIVVSNWRARGRVPQYYITRALRELDQQGVSAAVHDVHILAQAKVILTVPGLSPEARIEALKALIVRREAVA